MRQERSKQASEGGREGMVRIRWFWSSVSVKATVTIPFSQPAIHGLNSGQVLDGVQVDLEELMVLDKMRKQQKAALVARTKMVERREKGRDR